MSAHRSIAPVTSRAIRNAFTTSAGLAPVSVTIRETNVIPCALTTSFDGDRRDSSRLSGWSSIRWPYRSTTAGGK